ncbi:MAG: RnfH family protein [bacterium]
MEDEQYVTFEVAYALPDEQVILVVHAPADATVRQVIELSGIMEQYPEIDLDVNKTGIFGKAAKLDASLFPGDRVEIYRPLIADPKEVRRKRAAQGKKLTKGGG